jgi:hypothetical protein
VISVPRVVGGSVKSTSGSAVFGKKEEFFLYCSLAKSSKKVYISNRI